MMMYENHEILQKIQVLKLWDKEHNLGLFRKLIGDDVLDMEDDRKVLAKTWFSHRSHNIESIPSEIDVLQNLKRFWLNDVGLKSLPDTLCKIQSIDDLSVDRNALQKIPECIGNMKGLEYLDIESNKITSLPRSIGNLSKLLMLRANNNELTNIPRSIGKLKKLDRLYLADNPIGELPDSLEGCTSLEILDISGTNITTPPKWLEEMPSLKEVVGFPKLTLYYQKQLAKNEYGKMQITFRKRFNQDLTEEEISHKKGGLIGDEGLPLGNYVWNEKYCYIEYYVHWIPHYLGDSHGKIYKDGTHENLPTLPQMGEVTQRELDLREELKKKGLYA